MVLIWRSRHSNQILRIYFALPPGRANQILHGGSRSNGPEQCLAVRILPGAAFQEGKAAIGGRNYSPFPGCMGLACRQPSYEGEGIRIPNLLQGRQ